eukprot:1389471-Amorphochlora_amoeboformis.AAC.1
MKIVSRHRVCVVLGFKKGVRVRHRKRPRNNTDMIMIQSLQVQFSREEHMRGGFSVWRVTDRVLEGRDMFYC